MSGRWTRSPEAQSAARAFRPDQVLTKPMVLVSYTPYNTLVFYKLNSAIERGTKPDA
jgi:hypothetical protein